MPGAALPARPAKAWRVLRGGGRRRRRRRAARPGRPACWPAASRRPARRPARATGRRRRNARSSAVGCSAAAVVVVAGRWRSCRPPSWWSGRPRRVAARATAVAADRAATAPPRPSPRRNARRLARARASASNDRERRASSWIVAHRRAVLVVDLGGQAPQSVRVHAGRSSGLRRSAPRPPNSRSRGRTGRESSPAPLRRPRPSASRSRGGPGSTVRARVATRRPGRRAPLHVPTARPARKPGAEGGGLDARATPRPGRWVASARACTKVGLALMPPSTRSAAMATPVSASAASTRSAPRWATPSSTARTISGRPLPRVSAEQRAAGAVVPVRACPRPSSAGHVDDPPASVALRPPRRGSRPATPGCRGRRRSHSTLVPAVSMIASTPQVSAPPRDQATIGNVPCGPRAAAAGRSRAEAHVEHAAGAEGDLGLARAATQPWPISDACWSPTRPAIGGAPGSAVASPTHAARVDERRAASAPGCAARRARGRPSRCRRRAAGR